MNNKVMPSTRACTECHAAKVKCIKIQGSDVCKRCHRLGLKCVEHVSRQGQGTRRRKKVKTKVVKDENNIAGETLTITSNTKTAPCSFLRGGHKICKEVPDPIVPIACMSANICNGNGNSNSNSNNVRNNNGSIRENCAEDTLCEGMDLLQVEDNIICASISNGLGRDHFGVICLIRQWVALAFSRRSFCLLARASFIAGKMKIPMDDILSNQSPFAGATSSEPMDFLASSILLPKGQLKTFGGPLYLQEVPWDVLESVQIDPNRLDESVHNRVITIRWAIQGITSFWTSPLFARDFATTAEIGRTWEENREDQEVVDLFLPKSEKGAFAQHVFNLMFVNKKPNMPCYVTKNLYKVQKRNGRETIQANLIQTIKLLNLDSSIHYIEIQYLDQHFPENRSTTTNKRDHADEDLDNLEPIMCDGIEFTDIPITDDMEEFLKLISGDEL
mmetsp:Transcript_15121/g.31253  ORF Transcript_15121/g.31253 Transcript_15121/m.31253 type:complete len:446 (+) Transcript_15121:114-1451(+)|eukprot:CAMPEP_0168200898 /NCGR_PEP_ID=MMETSP0139_2-20121125/23346_1 /TAXON_ID=44445 /ORGANISM="Pseudo-nitzschia australis, Strain 10249 10 AB" /LENGTH=445 /DNA_ID=CAMNT_0008126273 /DNA_START=39 /DNA_END=1376 /DNA_ORIENTATION=+